MSQVSICPTCGSKSKIKETNGTISYETLQDKEILKKVSQLKKAMETFKGKAEKLEKELTALKNNQ
ncbi:hypothetical protein [Ulvibacter litoralis]|uniref:Uncharacterized protein n=1 Tax=Ulvibacter litoralis TaxID=227084 RepID=A0A1G7H3A0_9FLAO|nr:hypothetical protein [Ulvibacter litoralis]GHC59062.1 hypothetical protein GCM10008083_24760 [Ulvibacter litoralis]SDE94774.1 hypothetical protein SAMN05421855_103496 [Ulvibacter litoralis]